MEITTVPCLSDNYAYLVRDAKTGAVAVIDPSEPDAVLAALDAAKLTPTAILNTHHHHDHTGGNEGILARFPGIPVYAHAVDGPKVPGLTHALAHDETFPVGGLSFRALHIPGHTLGAVAFVVGDAAFTGDTLFLSGCGRLFEGTAEMMHHSLNVVLGALDGATRVYCGHEYTEKNLRFAASQLPDDAAVAKALDEAVAARAENKPTVPGSLARERAVNPFLRCGDPAVQKATGESDPVAVFAALRARRNGF